MLLWRLWVVFSLSLNVASLHSHENDSNRKKGKETGDIVFRFFVSPWLSLVVRNVERWRKKREEGYFPGAWCSSRGQVRLCRVLWSMEETVRVSSLVVWGWSLSPADQEGSSSFPFTWLHSIVAVYVSGFPEDTILSLWVECFSRSNRCPRGDCSVISILCVPVCTRVISIWALNSWVWFGERERDKLGRVGDRVTAVHIHYPSLPSLSLYSFKCWQTAKRKERLSDSERREGKWEVENGTGIERKRSRIVSVGDCHLLGLCLDHSHLSYQIRTIRISRNTRSDRMNGKYGWPLQRKATGNKWALYSRSFIQKCLFNLGSYVQVRVIDGFELSS